MAHSKVVNEADQRIGLYIYDAISRAEAEIGRLQRQIAVLKDMHKALRVCSICTGSGTVCEGRTADDMPDYQPCRSCKGRGHNREE